MTDYIQPQPLRNLIISLIGKSNIHIGVHDISGILNTELFTMEYYYKHHPKDICSAAKSGPSGFFPCTDCKKCANQKAINTKKLFYGHCEFGLFEIVKPVVIAKKVHCIIYIGNMIIDKEKTISKMKAACEKHKVSYDVVSQYLKDCEYISSPDEYINIANIIDSYMQLVYRYSKETDRDTPQSEFHWAVSAMLEYIQTHYMENITLEGISELYYMNPKYMGRLFKSQTGLTFHENLNEVRIEKAVDLLANSDKNILEIAMLAGFQNVTYFNRVFNKKYSTTPTKYRAIIKISEETPKAEGVEK